MINSKKACHYFALAEDTQSLPGQEYNIANYYFNAGKINKADSLYSILLSKEEIDDNLKSMILSSYAFLFASRDKPDFAKADSLFNLAVSISGRLNDSNHSGAFAYVLSATGQQELSEAIFDQLKTDEESKLYYNYWKSREETFNGKYKEAFMFLDAIIPYRNKSIRQALEQSTIKAQRDYFILANQRSEALAGKRYVMILLISILSFLTILALILVYHKKKIAETIEREELKESLRASETDLQNIKYTFDKEREKLRKNYISMYHEQFKVIGELYEASVRAETYTSSTESNKYLSSQIRNIVKFIGEDNDGQKLFESRINACLDNIVQHFKTDFPKLGDNPHPFSSCDSFAILGVRHS